MTPSKNDDYIVYILIALQTTCWNKGFFFTLTAVSQNVSGSADQQGSQDQTVANHSFNIKLSAIQTHPDSSKAVDSAFLDVERLQVQHCKHCEKVNVHPVSNWLRVELSLCPMSHRIQSSVLWLNSHHDTHLPCQRRPLPGLWAEPQDDDGEIRCLMAGEQVFGLKHCLKSHSPKFLYILVLVFYMIYNLWEQWCYTYTHIILWWTQ